MGTNVVHSPRQWNKVDEAVIRTAVTLGGVFYTARHTNLSDASEFETEGENKSATHFYFLFFSLICSLNYRLACLLGHNVF